MSKTYLATKEQLDNNNQTLSGISVDIADINAKIDGIDLSNIVVAILDFKYDDITITSGGYNSDERYIAT